MTWIKLKTGNWMGYDGRYYAFLRVRKHYVREGFDKYCQWWTGLIGTGGEWVRGEGIFTSYLSNIKKAKKWASETIKIYQP